MKSFAWPDGTRCAVFVSVNFDAEVVDLKSTTEDRLFGRFSYGRYGVRAGMPRLLALFKRRGIAATTFVTASDANRNPDAVRAFQDEGHEIASRGMDLTPLHTLGEGERAALAQARETIAKITGKAPVLGFFAPARAIVRSAARRPMESASGSSD